MAAAATASAPARAPRCALFSAPMSAPKFAPMLVFLMQAPLARRGVIFRRSDLADPQLTDCADPVRRGWPIGLESARIAAI